MKATRTTVEAEGERLHLPRSALPAQAQPPSLRLSPLRLVPAPPAGLIPDRPRLDRAGPRPLIVGSPSQRAPPSPRDPSPSKAATPQGPSQGRDQPHLSPNLHAWAQQLWMGKEAQQGVWAWGQESPESHFIGGVSASPPSLLFPALPPSSGWRCKTKRVPLSRLHNSASKQRPIFKS